MATTNTTKKPAAKVYAKPFSKKITNPTATRMSLTEAMRTLEKAGTAQTRKTYARHRALEPMFGASFAVLKALVKKIGVDHELALELWKAKNYDARMLAMKIADPATISASDLDRWAKETRVRVCGGYVAMLAAESPHGAVKARECFAASDAALRGNAWTLAGCPASGDEAMSDEWFLERLESIEKSIHESPDAEREGVNMAVTTIGGRNEALRKAATAAAKRIGKVEVDHGDTSCKTPDAVAYLETMWAHAAAKKFASPAAQERARESMRTRC